MNKTYFVLTTSDGIPIYIVNRSEQNKFRYEIHECVLDETPPTLYGFEMAAVAELENLHAYPSHYTWSLMERPLRVQKCLLSYTEEKT